jgi:hypothetical protein
MSDPIDILEKDKKDYTCYTLNDVMDDWMKGYEHQYQQPPNNSRGITEQNRRLRSLIEEQKHTNYHLEQVNTLLTYIVKCLKDEDKKDEK